MTGRGATKKKKEWDPNKSDSEDEDYDNRATHRSPRKPTGRVASQRGAASAKKSKPKPRAKTRRTNTYDSEDEDDLDDEITEISEEEEEYHSRNVSVQPEPMPLTRSGRPARAAVQKSLKYEEPNSDEEVPEEEEAPRPLPATEKKRLRVTLKVNKEAQQALVTPRNTRAASKEPKRPPSSGRTTRGASAQRQLRATPRQGSVGRETSLEPATGRKSSRLHPEIADPLMEMSNSGRIDFVVPKKHPSTVQEIPEEEMEDVQTYHVPVAGEIETHPIETSTEALAGSLETNHEEDLDAPGEEDDVRPGAPQILDIDADHDDDEDDDILPTRRTRGSKHNSMAIPSTPTRRQKRSSAPSSQSKDRRATHGSKTFPTLKPPQESRRAGSQNRATSDDEFQLEENNSSSSEDTPSVASPDKSSKPHYIVDDDDEEYSGTGVGRRQSTRLKGSTGGGVSKRKRNSPSEEEVTTLADEVADLQDSGGGRRSKRRATAGRADSLPRRPKLRERTGKVDYRIINPETMVFGDDPLMAPSMGDLGGGGRKPGAHAIPVPSLYGTSGPFGGWGSSTPIFGKTPFMGPGMDSDSSDDEGQQRRPGRGGINATPAHNTAGGTQPNLLPPTAIQNLQPTQQGQDPSGMPANFGKIGGGSAPGGSRSGAGKSSADSDPLGVDPSVSFDSVGGHEEHIRQLREMVALPLMYPELFQEFGITPPRGVLFHGPPGTGKTLMARALASSCSTQTGKKVTFFMRKGADCLSKWVGEAERQLRLLFEEAKNSQPSIIFFDEIDGLAPVRSAKQDQIHASIVSTLLALMDGMDGRGQIIVIGATNRPDSVDPALRRPGRFDREFYFPLPDVGARRKIIDIHTSKWEPKLSDKFKDDLAVQTKGFGGADLRGMCTEAALNAVQRVYPQLYTSWEKYLIDPKKIQIVAADFLKAIRKIVPSSERSSSSGAAPLPAHIQPLLSTPLEKIKQSLSRLLPERKRLTVLEEAMYEDDADPDAGFEREKLMADFENARVFRPRLLVHGMQGMGQQYVAAAMLHHFEGYHVQSFDMASLMSDSQRHPEAAVIQYFVEVKRHKPSVIFIPNIDIWWECMGPSVISTFTGLLRSIPPSDPILLLGITECDAGMLNPDLRNLFGYTPNNKFKLEPPHIDARIAYFKPIATNIKKSPLAFPDPTNRPKRTLEKLPLAPPPPPHQITQEELDAQARRDGQVRNWLRIGLLGWIEQSKQRYKKLKKSVVDQMAVAYLHQAPEPPPADMVMSDIPVTTVRPYELTQDRNGRRMIFETQTGRKFYNMDVDTIEIRISNGYYCLPRQFLDDIKLIALDAQTLATDKERILRANEMVANAEVYVTDLETKDPNWLADCERLYARQLEIQKEKEAKRAAKVARKTEEAKAASKALETSHTSNGLSNGGPPKPGSPSKHGDPSKSAEVVNLLQTPEREPEESSHHSATPLSNGFTTTTTSHSSNGLHAPMSDAPPLTSSSESHVSQAFHTAPAPSRNPSSHQPTLTPYQNIARPPHALFPGVASEATPSKMPIGNVLNEPSPTPSVRLPSQRTSGATTHSNGTSGPDFSMFMELSSGESQLPDTQVLSSSEGSGGLSSQAFPPTIGSQPIPYSQPNSYPPPSQHNSAPAAYKHGDFKVPECPESKLVVDEARCDELPFNLAQTTEGYTVEQLEQVNAALMNTIWNMRNDWNREAVRRAVLKMTTEVLKDIGTMQRDI